MTKSARPTGKEVQSMRKSDLRKRIAEYQAITERIAELEKQKDAVAEKIKRHMGDHEEERVDDFIIRYKEITSSRFDCKSFQKEHEDLYRQFSRPSLVRRFTITV